MLPSSLIRYRTFAALAALLAVLPPSSAQPPPPVATARAYFYTEPEFQGEVFVVAAGNAVNNLELIRDSRGLPFNDRVRSVQLEGPVRVLMYEHADFQGASMWLNGDVPDLGAFAIGPSSSSTWDRNISALQVQTVAHNVVAFVRWDRRDAERLVRASYRDILGRDPDGPGLRLYVSRLIEAGWSEEQLRDSLHRSDEFRHRDLDAIIRRAYREILDRDPDASGLSAYQRSLSRGMTEGEMRAELSRSREGSEKQVTVAITRAYHEILRRDPDPAGLANYTKFMRQKGWSESDVREDLRRSAEFRNLRGR